jgi:hypothetical protein
VRDEEWGLEGRVLKEVDESGNTKGEDMVEEVIINLLLLVALVLLLEVFSVELDLGIEDDDAVFLLDPAPVELLPAPLFCHNKALAPFLITRP